MKRLHTLNKKLSHSLYRVSAREKKRVASNQAFILACQFSTLAKRWFVVGVLLCFASCTHYILIVPKPTNDRLNINYSIQTKDAIVNAEQGNGKAGEMIMGANNE